MNTNFYFKLCTDLYNRLKNRRLAEHLRSNGNDLATVQFSVFCGVFTVK